ncbi:MAG: hypothetical protein QM690_05220 [Sphingobium sp.]
MMLNTASGRVRADPPIAWNDIEALPVYAALAMAVMLLWLAVIDLSPTLQAATIKLVGLCACIALRHAWLRLDEEPGGQT